MYLHLGASVVIRAQDVLGIFDLDTTTASHRTRAFLAQAEREKRVVSVGEDLPRAFLLCQCRSGKTMIYLSQFSPATLRRRLESGYFELV